MIRPLAAALALAGGFALTGCGSKAETAEQKADAVCACQTLACAQVANESLATHLAKAGGDETAEQKSAATTRATACVAKLQVDPSPEDAVAAAKAMADAICACKDLDCAQARNTLHAKRLDGFKKSTGSKDDAAQIKAEGKRAKACVVALRDGGQAAPKSTP